jgi:MoaA/NifB/PqqE/SkfB family radical SAM enzyme
MIKENYNYYKSNYRVMLANILFRISLFVKLYTYWVSRKNQKVRLDFCSACQLKCPLCSTGTGKNNSNIIGSGMLSPDKLKKFLELNRVTNIEVSNWGEIFLNKKLDELLDLATLYKVKLSAGNGVNFNNVTDKQLRSLIKNKFQKLSISIDGTDQETYETYRKGGNLNNVLNNIKKLNRLKIEYNSSLPKLSMQFIDFPHNTHQKAEAKILASHLFMDFTLKSNHSPHKKITDAKKVSKKSKEIQESLLKRKAYLDTVKSFYHLPCKQLWERPQINWDGNVLGCCINTTKSLGNAFETSLEEIKKSEKYLYAMQMVTENAPPRDDIPCSTCKYYKHK